MAHSSSASKPNSSEYEPINVQMESPLSPRHKPKFNPLSKITNSLSNHRKQDKSRSPKQASNKLLELKLRHSAPSSVSAYSDSDSAEGKSTPYTSPSKQMKMQFSYNFGDTEQIIKQELIESVLEQLKIGLTFLLHDESPLWNHEMDENDEEIDMNEEHKQQSPPIYAKGTFAGSQSSVSHHKSIGFQQRFTVFNKSGALFGAFRRTQKCVNNLFNIKYMKEHGALYMFWRQWRYYAKLKRDGHRINIKHLKLRDDIQENHQALEDDCIDFVESKAITKKTANAIVSAINKITGKTDESDGYLAKSVTISSLRLRSTQRSASSKRKTLHMAPLISSPSTKAILDDDCSEHQLKTVKTRQEMKKWIERFKSTEIANRMSRSCVCCGVKWIKVCFGQICCECKGLLDMIEKEDKNLRIPMDLWSWQNVVACIEDAVYVDDDGEQYELKHFASVFWQYQIEGKELVVMDVLQIELLVECWFLNNIQEQYFDEIKLKTQQEHDESWHLSQESEYLMRYIDKLRIHSHVVSRYQLSMDIVKLIVTETEQNELENNNNIYQDAVNIKYIIELLRSNAMDGPKMYWKSEAHFFHKIDNYLSVLICSPIIRQMYQKCFPDFLYEESPQNQHDIDELLEQKSEDKSFRNSPSPATPLRITHSQPVSASITRTKTSFNAFHSIRARLNRDLQNHSKRCSSTALSPFAPPSRKYARDALDRCTEACCDNACCVHLDATADFTECIHNLDRIYLKVMCLIISSMLLGCLFVIIYYSHHGEVQANDAMFLSLEAIGDRLSGKMSYEFWVPQMINSLTIGGLTTGDLLPNASSYTFPNYKFDQFFASFTTISHTTAVFSVFMYNHELNSMIGAYKVPDSADFANGSVVIMDHNGNCRRDRLYEKDLRMRRVMETVSIKNQDLPHYSDCDYDPRSRNWYETAMQIGLGTSQWTEPYVFSEQHQGMSYVTPIMWKGTRLIFVTEVTTYTLAAALSHELPHEHLPAGSLWMIVTPGFDAVASSVNETWIDSENCTAQCYSDNDMIYAAIHWMKAENISGEQHVSGYSMSKAYDISLYSFPVNHVNVHPFPEGADSNELMVKPLQLNDPSYYSYGYAVIVNDEHYMRDVRIASTASLVITIFSISSVLILILFNIRYNNIEQRQLGRQGRSGIIRATTTRRLRVASSKIHSFSKQKSFDSGSDSTVALPLDQTLNTLHFKTGNNQSTRSTLTMAIGDRVKTKDNKYAIVKFIGKVSGVHDDGQERFVLLELEHNKGTVLVPLTHVIMNFGNKLQIESTPSATDADAQDASNIHTTPINTAIIDNKILNASLIMQHDNKTLSAILNAGESDDDESEEDDIEDTISDEEEHKEQQAGCPSPHVLYSNSAKKHQPSPNMNGANGVLSVIEDDENEPADDDNTSCCVCVKEKHLKLLDERTKNLCYFPQKTLLYITYLCLCTTLIMVVLIWEVLTTDATATLFEDVMAKHEWSHVQDLVYQIFDSTEMIADVVTDRFYRNDMDLTNSHEMDRFFVNLMQSFVDVQPNYMQWYIYIATPNGNMRGARWNNSQNESTLSATIQDATTNNSYNVYLVNDIDGFHMKNVLTDTINPLYDPRCRGWYRDTLYYAFEGTVDEAFPDDAYVKWKTDINAPAYNVTNCIENRAIYESMWNITNISEPESWQNNTWKYSGVQHKMVWSRYLFAMISDPQIGLTASKPIIDEETGELLGIIAIDYLLQTLSEYIAATVNNPFDSGHSQIEYDRWHSWIFEANGEPQMIASSDGKVLRDAKETEGCYGFLVMVDNQKVPYSANEHPEAIIRVYSNVVIDVYGIDTLDINGTQSENIRVPAGLPQLEGGRIQYYPGGNHSIDWIVLKTTDVSASSVDDLAITIIAILLIMACVWVLLKELDYTDNKMELSDLLKRRKGKKKEEDITANDLDRSDYFEIMEKMRPIVDGAANSKWYRLINDSDVILTTEQAKLFLANRANEHIASENENNAVFRECAWNACNYQKLSKRLELKFWEFIESNYYDVPVQILLFAHLIITLWEPSTPKQLRENGLDWNLVIALAAFQIIQWFDCILVGIKRYFEFKIKEPFLTSLYELNYGFYHKFTQQIKKSGDKFNTSRHLRAIYLTIRGPHCKRYLVHLLFVSIDFFNFILQITFGIAPFSYYIPILPALIIVRNHHVLLFGSDFISALIYAKDVLFSYFCFILIFAILSMSLFSGRVNETEFADSFESINSAFITGFVFISTSENYAIMYDVFESDYYSDSHWIVLGNVVFTTIFFAMCGMFCWIPMIIDKFEAAFEESNMRHDEKNKLRKTNAIIASFVMLDFNGDLDIDHTEFECLITCSVLIEKNKLFSAFDENNSNTLDIYEFVDCLLKQSFRTKIISSSTSTTDSKFTAFCECNIFRHREYTLYTFVFLVIPVIGFSVIKGLTHRFDEHRIDSLIILFFILNMIEIHLRCFCFGCARFWDLLKYPNPNYVIAAIDKYRASQTELMQQSKSKYHQKQQQQQSTIRLTSSERNWVTDNLAQVRPLSILEKSTQTLINRIELISFWLCLAAYFGMQILFEFHSTDESPDDLNNRYCLYFIQLAVMARIFTLIPSNQQLIYIIFQVFPDFIALFAFLGLYIYSWARIGCTLFGDNKTDIVLPEIYEPAEDMVANFDSLSYAILALIQLMIGEGWHEVMYFNTIGTAQVHSLYFIIYITVCSLIIANVFVGLFLADIDEFTQQQSHDEIIKHSTKKSKSFQVYAKQKLNKLFYQMQQNLHQNKLMNEQIHHINFILYQQQLQQQQMRQHRRKQSESIRHQQSSSPNSL